MSEAVSALANVLLVEDETNLGSTLSERLKIEGYQTTWASSFQSAKNEIGAQTFDLAILDVGLPDGSGLDLADVIRKKNIKTGILFLTAFSNPEDRIKGLEAGAEDYVVKPFHLKELLLRVANALKRTRYLSASSENAPIEVVIGRAKVDFSKFEARCGDQNFSLTQKECLLLKLLHERKGRVVSRDTILDFVWSDQDFPTARTVDNFIMRLRRIVEIEPENPKIIRSIRGVGYQLYE
jgi:two-component system alkaline phosphatase synthesis response regulator PhoP